MENTDVSTAQNVAERIREKVENTEFDDNWRCTGKKVTISGGIAGYPEHGLTLMEIINKADIALYRAKDRGKNTVVLYED